MDDVVENDTLHPWLPQGSVLNETPGDEGVTQALANQVAE